MCLQPLLMPLNVVMRRQHNVYQTTDYCIKHLVRCLATTQAAKQAVNRTLAQALKTPVTTLASKAAANPIKTAVLVEGTAGTLQNVAAQKAEMAADLRD